jgi:DNA replication protein DnaC
MKTEYYLKQVNVPDKYLNASLFTSEFKRVFNQDMGSRLREIYDKSLRVIQDKIYGLYFSGANGVGKSYLACALLRHCIDTHECSVARATAQEIIDYYFENNFQGERPRYLKADFLLIEELGREVNFKSDQKIKIIENLVKSRVDSNKRITLFTSNCEITEVKKLYSDYLFNLISSTCVTFEFPGEDLRHKQLDNYIEKL